ncbi:MAG: 16S rRNA (cytidine(1402)-2'-O)-methyltransferase, partial [Lachnospiraceae bacterium]|nr:16S rRNA (cytidine(1402)-2'-O)-methyltransferase [Lachnospiraceae bacterium]
EYVLVVEGRSLYDRQNEQRAGWQALSIKEHMEYYEEQGIERKEAMRLVAKDRGISKREVYQHLLPPTSYD